MQSLLQTCHLHLQADYHCCHHCSYAGSTCACVCCAVRAVLAERGDDPALAAATAEQLRQEWEQGEGGRLRSVMAALSRPTRIVRGKAVDPAWSVDTSKFELPEEHALHKVCGRVLKQALMCQHSCACTGGITQCAIVARRQ
jgi:glycyl-tRNA synthetase beta subunit